MFVMIFTPKLHTERKMFLDLKEEKKTKIQQRLKWIYEGYI